MCVHLACYIESPCMCASVESNCTSLAKLKLPSIAMQEGLGGAAACSSLGSLLKGMLAALSNPATAAQLLAEGASMAAPPAQPPVVRHEGSNSCKAAGSRPLVIQLKPRRKLKTMPDAQGASGDTALCSTTPQGCLSWRHVLIGTHVCCGEAGANTPTQKEV